jgi:hypothetical protein
LGSNYPYRFTFLHHPARSQVTAVAFGADTALAFASEHRTNFNGLDAGCIDPLGYFLGDFTASIDDHFT